MSSPVSSSITEVSLLYEETASASLKRGRSELDHYQLATVFVRVFLFCIFLFFCSCVCGVVVLVVVFGVFFVFY